MDENYVPMGPEPIFVDDEPLSEMTPSFGAYFTAAAGNVLRDSPTSSVYRGIEAEQALEGTYYNYSGERVTTRPDRKLISAEDAKAKAEEAGVKVDFGEGTTTPEAVAIMIDRARRKHIRDTTIAAYDPSMGTQLGISLAVSLADPLNIGAAFIPFVGEARYGAILAGATGLGGRTARRAALGAVEGLAGSALVEPVIAFAATQEGRDYTLADSMYNLAFGTAFGSGLHAAGGAVKEKLFKRRVANEPPITPADIVERLPTEVNEVALRAAISDLVHGRKVQSSEIIDSLLEQHPGLQRSISLASTLRRDGPELDDMAGRVTYWEGQLAASREKLPKAQDFMTFVRGLGGIRDEDGSLASALGNTSHLATTAYVSAKGAKRTKRGVTLDALLAKATEEGYVTSLDELVAALRPGAKIVSQSAQKAKEARADLLAHIERMQTESGVAKNKPLAARARAIAGREQHLIAAERARITSSLDALRKRKTDYQDLSQPQRDTPAEEWKPEPSPKAAAAGEEPIAVGDLVNVAMGEEKIQMTAKPVRVTQVFEDPVYGRYVLIEGSSTGIAAKDLVRVGSAAEKPAPDGTPVAEAPAVEAKPAPEPTKPAPGSKTYTTDEVFSAIKEALKANDNRRVNSLEVMDALLPGISKKAFAKSIAELQKMQPNLMKTATGTGKKGEHIFFRPFTTEEKATNAHALLNKKINAVRRVIDEQFPHIGASKTYYVRALFDYHQSFEFADEGFVRYINKMVDEGKASLIRESDGQPVKLTKAHLEPNAPEVFVLFDQSPEKRHPLAQPDEAPAKTKTAKDYYFDEEAGEWMPIESRPQGEPVNVPPPATARVDSPPAIVEALKSEEINAAEAQFREVEAQTQRRLDAMMQQLPADTALALKAQLAKVDGDAAHLEDIYNTATKCLLNPN